MDWKEILHSPVGILAVVLIAGAALFLLYTASVKQGRSFTAFGFGIGERKADGAGGTQRPPAIAQSPYKYEKLVYAKVLFLRDQQSEYPLYYRTIDGISIPISDETVYVSLHVFDELRTHFKWNISTSGIAEPNAIFPWEVRPVQASPLHGSSRQNMVMGSGQPSSVYLAFSHFFNGQQPGNRDVFIHIEENADRATLVLDLSSIDRRMRVAGVREDVNGKRRHLHVHEERNQIFRITDTDLRMGERLRLIYEGRDG